MNYNTDNFNENEEILYDGMRPRRRVRKKRSFLPMILLTLLVGFLMGAAIMFFMFPVILHFETERTADNPDNSVIIEADEEINNVNGTVEEEVNGQLLEEKLPKTEEDPAEIILEDEENTYLPEEPGNVNFEEEQNAEETVSQDDSENGIIENLKQALLNGEGTLEALRQTFKGQIMVVSSGKFHFFPILDSMAKNNYKQENLVENDDGSLDYILPDGKKAKKGVDVSKYQGDIDWEKVKNAGIEFAFIRAGIRGYGTGALVPDEKFYENAVEASKQHIEIGAYFFSQAVNEEEAVEEARLVIDSLSGNRIPLPVVYDLEYVEGGRINSLSVEERTRNCRAFCDTIRGAGYEAMVYGNMETMLLMLDLEQLRDIEKWFSFYRPGFYYPYDYAIWQYTDRGYVDGINGKVDMNLLLR